MTLYGDSNSILRMLKVDAKMSRQLSTQVLLAQNSFIYHDFSFRCKIAFSTFSDTEVSCDAENLKVVYRFKNYAYQNGQVLNA